MLHDLSINIEDRMIYIEAVCYSNCCRWFI